MCSRRLELAIGLAWCPEQDVRDTIRTVNGVSGRSPVCKNQRASVVRLLYISYDTQYTTKGSYASKRLDLYMAMITRGRGSDRLNLLSRWFRAQYLGCLSYRNPSVGGAFCAAAACRVCRIVCLRRRQWALRATRRAPQIQVARPSRRPTMPARIVPTPPH